MLAQRVCIGGAGILGEHLASVRKRSSVKQKGRKKGKARKEIACNDKILKRILSNSFNIKILTNTNYMLFMRFSRGISQKIST